MKTSHTLIVLTLILLLAACGKNEAAPATSPENSEVLAMGKSVFQANCAACHSTTSEDVLVGPSMLGLADRAGKIVNGLDAQEYIEQSILDPGAYINDGFTNLMPATYGSSLGPDELEAVISYLLTFD